MTRRSILTIIVAVLGLALSAALAWSASQLAGQRIGLASEPFSVTRGLAPHHSTTAAPPRTSHDDRRKLHSKPKQAAPTASTQIFRNPAPVTPAATPATPPATTNAAPAATGTSTAPPSSTSAPPSSSDASQNHSGRQPDD